MEKKQMYRVMIIDDEAKMRNLLKHTIKWELLGFQVVGESNSGIEAINTIDDLRPDIVFVDIRMPFMDGIEFAQLAITRYPAIKIIILTAYSDFEYAKKCIDIGVGHYLLKPVDKAEINEVLRKYRVELDQKLNVHIGIKNDNVGSSSMENIKAYIIDNFSDHEINLTSVAIKFGFNSSYLSRAFKETVGVSFIDFLTGCRMEYAISLSKNNEYMYQVGSEVGIPDPNYFGKCFKKYTGMTFSQYTKKPMD